jgi:alpha-galactosidase
MFAFSLWRSQPWRQCVRKPLQWTDLKITGRETVRDLWRQKDLGAFEGSFSAPVASPGVVLVRIFPARRR